MCRARRPLLTPKWLRDVTGDTFDCALFTAGPGGLLEADIILLANREPRQRGSHLTLGKWIRTFGFLPQHGWMGSSTERENLRPGDRRTKPRNQSVSRAEPKVRIHF